VYALDAVDEIQSVGGVVEGPSGLYLTDPRAAGVFRFDSAGRLVGRVGRTGPGPGEYRIPARIGRLGDSLWVWDPGQHRMLFYRPDGSPHRTVTLASSAGGNGAVLADGSIVVIPTWSSMRGFPDAPPTLPVLRFGPDGAFRDTLFPLEVELGQMKMDMRDGSFRISTQPFGDLPLLMNAAGGSGFVRVDRPTTGAATFTVRRLDTNGRATWTRTIPYVAAAVDRALIDSVVGRFTRSPAPGIPGVEEPVVRAAIKVPPRMVPVLAVSVAPDGTIWLQRPVPVGSPARYTVLDTGGTPRHEVILPAGGRLAGFGAMRVYVVTLDDSDLPRLTRYRLE
jgi:hypothetical protein